MNKIGNVMGEQFFCTKRTICGGIVRCVTESELAPVCGEASRPEVRVGKHEQVFDGRTTKQKRTSEPARIPHVSIPGPCESWVLRSLETDLEGQTVPSHDEASTRVRTRSLLE